MSELPHQVQRKLEIMIDSAAPFREEYCDPYPRINGNYVRTPSLRGTRWVRANMTRIIRVAAKRHQWREEITAELKRINGEDND